ncbi:secretogranin-2 [Eublepharis macularius]|uniref:Secretogranin-2 n=1 Tax=Eublepharis macularius TaxID=481883 RepID=A0AA97JK63_EUBMA|nr:secretogranin-2 [Eublepharis macularius]XP_054839325.1 secretogranin-2 [Eublepharis macularius]
MADAKISLLGTALLFALLFALICFASAASFQRYQNIQKDPNYLVKNLQRIPSPDMIKALEYIENLRKQTGNGETSPDYSSYQGLYQSKDQNYLPDNLRETLSDEESQWVKAMLEALRQGERDSNGAPKENKLYGMNSDNVFLDGMTDDYDDRSWADTRHKHSRKPHTYFEENSRDSPYKRTNEIVEEQYTPQSLATLESVFQELGKMMGPSNSKKERFDEEQKLYADDEDDAYKGNNIAYEDVVGGEDWNPVEEKVESQTQEEIRNSKEEIEKNEEEIDDEMKRAGILDEAVKSENKDQTSDDVSKLMDYYLKKMMNSAGSDILRAKQSEDKRAVRLLGKPLDPQTIYQLIEISRNLQIPPEDLIEMLRAGDKHPSEKEQEPELPEDTDEIPETNVDNSEIFQNRMNSLNGYRKQRLNFMPDNLPENINVEDIINLLGTENVNNQKPSYLVNQLHQENGLPRVSYIPGRSKGHQLPKASWFSHLERRQMEQETLNEKEEDLAGYLAKMLSKYPEVINTGQVKQIPLTVSSEDDLQEDDQFEQAIKEHLNQPGSHESDKLSSFNKRVFMTPEIYDTQNRPYMDEDLLAKILEYLNQDESENGRDHITKRAMENM